jgi:phosphoadenosine phosphosulfate reductase
MRRGQLVVGQPKRSRVNAIELYARATPGHDTRVAGALAVLRAAAAEHGNRVVQATSLGAEDMVITDLMVRHGLAIPVATLETGMLHPETVALIGRIEARYGLSL